MTILWYLNGNHQMVWLRFFSFIWADLELPHEDLIFSEPLPCASELSSCVSTLSSCACELSSDACEPSSFGVTSLNEQEHRGHRHRQTVMLDRESAALGFDTELGLTQPVDPVHAAPLSSSFWSFLQYLKHQLPRQGTNRSEAIPSIKHEFKR